jgi:zinc protease
MSMQRGRTVIAARKTSKPATDASGVALKAGARIREHRLENGLTLLLAERHLDPVVAVMLWYRVGARNETERESGVSHFLEHMRFKGSARFGKGQVDFVTTTLGGSNNAFTTPDHTAYWFEFASDRWEKALEIEADRMKNLLIDAAEFQAEKAVVLEELSMGDDDPWRALSQEVQAVLFPRHPYRRPVIGYADTLQALTPADMRDYYRRFYHPSNAILVLAGDFDPESALEHVKQHFGSIENPSVPDAGPGVPPPRIDSYRAPQHEPKGEQRITIGWDDSASRLCIAWPTVVVGTDDDFALDLASTLLSGGRMSRLHRRLVLQRGLATSVATHNDTRIDAGAFWLHAECAQGVEPEVLEAAIDAELDILASEYVPAAELARAKRMLAASEAHESETVSDLAEDLGEFAADASWRMALETIERIERVTAREVRECVARFLRKHRRVLGWSLPRARVIPASSASAKEKRARPSAAARKPKAARAVAKNARRSSSASRQGTERSSGAASSRRRGANGR